MFFSDLIWWRNGVAYMTEKMIFTPFDRFFPSVLLWIESMTLIFCYSVKTVVLFQLELSLATVTELTISPPFFFPPSSERLPVESSFWRTVLFCFFPAWELTSFFWNLARWQYLRFPFHFPVLSITVLPAVFDICLRVSSTVFLMLHVEFF